VPFFVRVVSQIGGFAGATYTPFSADGLSVDLDAIAEYASFLAKSGLYVVFVNGTSGESMSLSETERKAITERWVIEGKKQSPRVRVIAHVGSDSLTATMELARHAESVGVDAISAMTPIMFKPSAPEDLAAWIKHVCSAAPATPFYYYHFPVITGLQLNALSILKAVEAAKIPQFRGFKFTDFNLFAYESCLTHSGGVYDVCYGRDEAALGGMATGAPGHVGNGFCFMIGPFNRIKAGKTPSECVCMIPRS
jgi:N-acetylneuraminate lyase